MKEAPIRDIPRNVSNSTARKECGNQCNFIDYHLAQCQCDISVFLAHIDLAASRWCSTRPTNRAARGVRGSDRERVARERISKNIGKVVPDLAVGQGVGIVRLRRGIVETVFNGGDLDSYTTGGRISVQGFKVVVAWLEGVLLADSRVYRPEVDWE